MCFFPFQLYHPRTHHDTSRERKGGGDGDAPSQWAHLLFRGLETERLEAAIRHLSWGRVGPGPG